MTAPIRVLLVDDDALMRAGLEAILSSDSGVHVVGEASDGRVAVEQVRRLQPDVVLMDIRMPEVDGIAATREVVAVSPDVRVVILTTFEDDDYIFGALTAGASGFLLKRTSPEQLLEALRAVAAGDSLLSPSVTRRVIDRMAALPSGEAILDRRLDALTAREREVLEQLARGLSNAEVAAALVIEESTVKTHVKRVLMKLGLRDRVQAVIFAYESGLVSPGPKPGTERDSCDVGDEEPCQSSRRPCLRGDGQAVRTRAADGLSEPRDDVAVEALAVSLGGPGELGVEARRHAEQETPAWCGGLRTGRFSDG